MATLEDLRKKYSSDPVSTSGKKTEARVKTTTLDDLRKKYGQTSDRDRVDGRYIDSFLSDADAYIRGSQAELYGITADNANSVVQNKYRGAESLRSRSDAIRHWYETNRSAIGEESYAEMMKYLDNVNSDIDSVLSVFGDEELYYNPEKYSAQHEANEARIGELKESLPWYADSFMPDFMEDWFLSDEQKEQRGELYALREKGAAYGQAVSDKKRREIEGMSLEEIEAMLPPDEVVKKFEELDGFKRARNFADGDGRAYLDKVIAELEEELAQYERIAYTTPDGKNVTWQALYDRKKDEADRASEIESVKASPDFNEYASAGAAIVNPTPSEAENGVYIFGKRVGRTPEVGNIVTYSRDNADELAIGEANGGGSSVGAHSIYRLMTDEEVSVYNYYLAKYGKERGAEYLESIYPSLENRLHDDVVGNYREFAENHPVWASAASVVTSLGSGAEYLEDIFEYARTGKLDRNTLGEATSTVRQTVSEKVDWEIGNWDAFDFVYNTGMSAADSAASMLTLGQLGGVSLGLSAAAQATNDALDRGMSNKDAFANGFMAGVFEGVFETVSIGKFNALKEGASRTAKDIAKNIGKSMLVNASEETLTELANIAYDTMVNMDFSTAETKIRQYMDMGMTEDEARMKVAVELAQQVVESGASGALMGFGFGAVGSVSSAVTTRRADKAKGQSIIDQGGTDALRALAEDMYRGRKGAEARRAGKLTERIAEGTSENPSRSAAKGLARNVGELSEMIRTGKKTQTPTETAQDAPQRENIEQPTEKASEAETPSTPSYEVSESGETIQTESGKPADIVGIESSENGEVKLKLADGSVVDSRDVSYGSDAEALVYETIASARADTESAKAIQGLFSQIDVTPDAASDIALSFMHGTIGYEGGIANLSIPEEVRKSAYNLGRMQRVRETAAKTEQISAKKPAPQKKNPKKMSKKNGNVFFDGFVYKKSEATELQRASVEAIETISKLAPSVEIHVYRSFVSNGKRYAYIDGKRRIAPNGYYKSGTNQIYIDIEAGDRGEGAMLYTLGHELTHYVSEWSAEDFQKLGDFLIKNFSEVGVPVETLIERKMRVIRKSYEADGKKAPTDRSLYTKAYEEVVADSMVKMLTDESTYEKLLELKKQDATLFEKFGEALRKLIDRIKKLLVVYASDESDVTIEAGYVSQFAKEIYDELQDLYVKAFEVASENYEFSEQSEGEQYSERYQSADTNSEILSMVERVENGNFRANEKVQLGIVPDETAEEIYRLTGIDVHGFVVAIEARQIEHILKDHGKSGKSDRSMADPTDIAKLEYALENYDDIRAAGKTRAYKQFIDGKTVWVDTVLYEKEIGNKSYYVVQAIPDTKAKTLYIVTAFIGKKGYKKEVSQFIDVKNPDATPESEIADTSNRSISQETDSVNREISENGDHNQYSERADAIATSSELYERYSAKYTERNRVLEEMKRIEESDAYRDFHETIRNGSEAEVDAIIEPYGRWLQESGYASLRRSAEELDKEIKDLYDRYQKTKSAEELETERKAIEATGKSEADYRRSLAVKEFGYTPYFYDAGYILPNGKMLNFSGEKGKHHGSRDEDHRAIGNVYTGGIQGTSAMLRFMSDGNVRIMAESPGIDLGIDTEPTAAQYGTISRFITNSRTRRAFYVDFTDKNGRSIGSLSYDGNLDVSEILYDIKEYYRTGTVRDQSEENQYSERDTAYLDAVSRGDMVTAQRMVDEAARKAMPNSLVRDENGELLMVYHGSQSKFTVFSHNKMGRNGNAHGRGFYFTELRSLAEGYEGEGGQLLKGYLNIEKPLSEEEVTIKKHELVKLVRETCREEAKRLVSDDGYSSVQEALYDTWVSNYVMTYGMRMDSVYREVADIIYSGSDNDVEMIAELTNAGAGTGTTLRLVSEILGYDGVIYTNEEYGHHEFVALNSNQFKSADPVTYDDNGEVIPLSERFKSDNEDIRYQERTSDSMSPSALLESIDDSIDMTDAERVEVDRYKKALSELAELQEARSYAEGKEARAEILRKINNARQRIARIEQKDSMRRILAKQRREVYRRAKAERDEAIATLQRENKEVIATLHAENAEAIATLRRENREKKHAAVVERNKTKLRQKIRKALRKTASLLAHGTKERNVKEELRGTVASAIALGEYLFYDSVVPHADIVRMGVESATEQESLLLNRYADLLDNEKALTDRIEALSAETTAIREKSDLSDSLYAEIEELQKQLNKTRREIKSVDAQLSNVFQREQSRINRATIDQLLLQLESDYNALQNSDADYIRNAYSEGVASRIAALKKSLDGVPARNMTEEQLTELYDILGAIQHMITFSNKLFREGRIEALEEYVGLSVEEMMKFYKETGDPVALLASAKERGKQFFVNTLKPAYFFEMLGSDTMKKLFTDVIESEQKYGRMIDDATRTIDAARKKYGYEEWDFEKPFEYRLANGRTFRVTLGEMMSIYGYSKRNQAYKHMTVGGFTFDKNSVYSDKIHGILPVKKKHAQILGTYVLTEAEIRKVISDLSEQQRAYVDVMQSYMTSLGSQGNEVSRTLYGINLFEEEAYIPIYSESDYLNAVKEALSSAPTQVSLKNTGMTKRTTPGANNPMVLMSFDDLWMEHVDNMSKYCSFVLAIENLQRVFNTSSVKEGEIAKSVKNVIRTTYGDGAVSYLSKYITDLNGGVNANDVGNPLASMFTKFKKTAVGASLSVVVQQPFAVVRAMSMVDPKYFVPFVGKQKTLNGMRAYEEMRKYAPIVVVKEMGGFDTGSSTSSTRYMENVGYKTQKGKAKAFLARAKYRNAVIDDVMMFGAQKMDELGWTVIWNAVKKEVAAEGTHKVGTDKFLEACGKRFTEVIVYTQVYDSINARSGFMRSKNEAVKYAVSFIGEPTTTMNMLWKAGLDVKRANGKAERLKATKKLASVCGAVVASMIMTNAAKSLIYALRQRDDEEDESLVERFMQKFSENLLDDANPLNYFPFLRDVVSIFEGFTVERPDTELLSDIIQRTKAMFTGEFSFDELTNFAGAVANLFGIPAKNVVRDVKASINAFKDLTDGINPTGKRTASSALPFFEIDSYEKLYDALVSGDSARLEVYKSKYKTDFAYESAVKRALTENDSRIAEAVVANVGGDVSTRVSLIREIMSEGIFSQSTVQSAVNEETNRVLSSVKEAKKADKNGDTKKYKEIVKGLLETYPKDFIERQLGKPFEEEETEEKEKGIYSDEDYFLLVSSGNISEARSAKEEVVRVYIANGDSAEEANRRFTNAFRTNCRNAYADGTVTRSKAESLITTYGGFDLKEDPHAVYWEMRKFDYYKQNGSLDDYSKYGEFYTAVRTGKNLKNVIETYTSHGVTKSTLATQITSYYKPIYKAASKSERAKLQGYLLNAYSLLGYSRTDKIKDINDWTK